MDLMNYIEAMREFREREGYYPPLSGILGAAMSKAGRKSSSQGASNRRGRDSYLASASGRGSEARNGP